MINFRPNPDDVLCFKNLLFLDDMTANNNQTFNQIEPKIHLRFNFAIVEATDNQTLSNLPARVDTKSRTENDITPQPKPDITAHVESEDIQPEPLTVPTADLSRVSDFYEAQLS